MYKKILFFSLLLISSINSSFAIHSQNNMKSIAVRHHHEDRDEERRMNRCYRKECYNRGWYGEKCYLKRCHNRGQHSHNRWW